MKLLYTLVYICFPLFCFPQITKQPDYTSFQKANLILNKAIRYTGIESDSINMAINANGIIHESGHFPAPEERINMPESYMLQLFKGASNYFFKGELTYRNRPYTQQVYYKGDSLFFRSYFARAVTQKSIESPTSFLNEILTLHPALLLPTIRQRGLTSLRYVGKHAGHELISSVVNGTLFTLRIGPNGQLNTVSYLSAHSYYGDNVHTYAYDGYQPTGQYNLPTTFKEYEFGALRKEETYSYDFKPGTELPVNQVCPGCALLPKSVEVGTTTQDIGSGLYVVNLDQYNNRVLLLVGDKGVTVFEAPVSYEACQQVIKAAQQIAPSKPISPVFITHHHPDHAGGLRAFAELGAEIITTKGNTSFLGKLVNFPHELSGEKAFKPLKPSFVVVDSLRTFNAGTTAEFSVFFTGDTQHTNEYLLAYFPKQKVLFQGDLCFFPENGNITPATVREQAVWKVMERNRLDVEKIYGSWPLRGYKAFGTKAELSKKIQAMAR